MTDQTKDRQNADALYRYHQAAVSLNHTKHRLRGISAALRSAADTLDEEINNGKSITARVGAMLSPLVDTVSAAHDVINASVLDEAIRELREANDAANSALEYARGLGVDPMVK